MVACRSRAVQAAMSAHLVPILAAENTASGRMRTLGEARVTAAFLGRRCARGRRSGGRRRRGRGRAGHSHLRRRRHGRGDVGGPGAAYRGWRALRVLPPGLLRARAVHCGRAARSCGRPARARGVPAADLPGARGGAGRGGVWGQAGTCGLCGSSSCRQAARVRLRGVQLYR